MKPPPFLLRRLVPVLAAGLMLGCLLQASHAATLVPLMDARQDGLQAQAAQQPIVVLFSMPDCAWCPQIRNNYLAPLAGESSVRPGPLVRELDITGRVPLKDFDGREVAPRQFSQRYRVRATPTVLLLDAEGRLLAEPLVGADTAGFYGAYLEGALDSARRNLKSGRRLP